MGPNQTNEDDRPPQVTTKNGTLKNILVLIAVSYVFLVLGNGLLSLTNPDEVFYVQTAKEMIQRDSWMTPYLFGVPQFEKPIFLYWLLRIGLAASGASAGLAHPVPVAASGASARLAHPASVAFATRFFPAIFAVIGVIAVYFLARLGFKNERKAFFSAIILMSSGLYIGLARTVYTDMIFSGSFSSPWHPSSGDT
jgi:4-amino-4-deoxy-L-arabinose transferase